MSKINLKIIVFLILVIYSLIITNQSFPQNTWSNHLIKSNTNETRRPEFPGGEDSLYKFLERNVIYPEEARKNDISGTVEVVFSVDIDGSIDNLRIIKDLGYGCDEEALRVVKLMPKWVPGETNGKDVSGPSLSIEFHKKEGKKEWEQKICEYFLKSDTITKNGNYFRYKIKGIYAYIEYGNKNFSRILPDRYDCSDSTFAHIPIFRWDNQDYICVESGCGSECWTDLILPLNPTEKVQRFEAVYADKNDNLIVYLDKNKFNIDELVVENFKEHIKQIIELDFHCEAVWILDCIEIISLDKENVVYNLKQINHRENDKIIEGEREGKQYQVKLDLK